MKVCHITSAHRRYDVRIFEKECCSLAKAGYDTYLVVNDDKKNEQKQGVKIVSTGYNPVSRRERMFSSMRILLKKALEIDADIYHLHDPELLQIVSKLRKKNKKVIFDVHEDTELQIMDKEWIPNIFRRIIAGMYRFYSGGKFKTCNGIITVTPAIVKKMKKYSKNVIMITNYPILSEMSGDKRDDSSDYIFFAGGISKQWCHDRIIKALENIENVRYKLAGPVEDGYMEILKQCKGWDKVEYLGKIPHFEVQQLYTNAIAGMAVNECSQIRGEGTLGNTKLFEIMEAAVPVICTNYRLWRDVVEKNKCGICVDCQSIDAIKKAIIYFRNNTQKRIEMGVNGRCAVEREYNWENERIKLIKYYEAIIKV